jgi:hypothetical protein
MVVPDATYCIDFISLRADSPFITAIVLSASSVAYF